MKKFLFVILVIAVATAVYFLFIKEDPVIKKKVVFTKDDYRITLNEDFVESKQDRKFYTFNGIDNINTKLVNMDLLIGTKISVYPEIYIQMNTYATSATTFTPADGSSEMDKRGDYRYTFWSLQGYDNVMTVHTYKRYYYVTEFRCKEDTVKNPKETFLKFADTIKFEE